MVADEEFLLTKTEGVWE